MLTIQQAQRLLRTGAISSEQLVLYCHARATAGNNCNNAYERTVDQHTLVQQARQSDARRQQGTLLSPLDGIPFSAKANLAVASQPLTAGSDILRTAAASVGYNAQVVEAMLSSGAVLTGITAMDEFGMGSLGTNRSKGMPAAVKNPMKGWHGHDRHIDDEEMKTRILSNTTNITKNTNNTHFNYYYYYYYSPGGSSSGSAVSVAQSAALVSLASDTGGSVRLPAAWCGIAGYKPAYGTLSRDGLVAYASSLDTVGILAPTAECIAAVMKQLLFQQQTQPRRDSTLRKQQSVSHSTTTTNRLEGFKVAIPTAFVVKEMPPEIRDNWWNAAQQLERQGATIHIDETISPRILQQALAAYYVLACAEASSNLARYDGFRYGQAAHFDLSSSLPNNNHTTLLEQQYAHTRTLGFGPEVIRRILCGTAVLSSNRYHSHYEAAAKLRAVLAQQMRSVLNEYDVLLVPTTLHPPLRLDDSSSRNNNNSTESMANDIMTVPGSLGGFPCLAVPYGQWKHDSSHRPPCAMSVQFIAAQHDDAKLFQAAAALQEFYG